MRGGNTTVEYRAEHSARDRQGHDRWWPAIAPNSYVNHFDPVQ